MSLTISPTTDRPASRGGRARFARVAIALGAVFASILVSSPQADAQTYWQHGRPGAIQLPRVEAYADYLGPFVQLPRHYVWRSPASTGSQRVVLAAVLYRYNRIQDRYYHERSSWIVINIPAGANGAYLPALRMATSQPGDYTLDYSVGWYRTTNGTSLGTTDINMWHARDYVCADPAPHCQANRIVGGRGSVYLAY